MRSCAYPSSTTSGRPSEAALRPSEAILAAPGTDFMQDRASQLPSIYLPRTTVNSPSGRILRFAS